MSVFELLDDNLFDCISETDFINDPERAILSGPDSWGPFNIIQKSKFSKSLPDLELFDDFGINLNINNAIDEDKEGGAGSSGFEDSLSCTDSTIPHGVLDVIELIIGEVVEDEMIFETLNDEVLVGLGFLFVLWL